MKSEILYPLESVSSFINDDLQVYPMTHKGEPDINTFDHLSKFASDWVNLLSNDDDFMISELIYWLDDKIYDL